MIGLPAKCGAKQRKRCCGSVPLTRASGPRTCLCAARAERSARNWGFWEMKKEGAVHTGCCHLHCWDTAINECAHASSFRAHFLECPFALVHLEARKRMRSCVVPLCSCFFFFFASPWNERLVIYTLYILYIYIYRRSLKRNVCSF